MRFYGGLKMLLEVPDIFEPGLAPYSSNLSSDKFQTTRLSKALKKSACYASSVVIFRFEEPVLGMRTGAAGQDL